MLDKQFEFLRKENMELKSAFNQLLDSVQAYCDGCNEVLMKYHYRLEQLESGTDKFHCDEKIPDDGA